MEVRVFASLDDLNSTIQEIMTQNSAVMDDLAASVARERLSKRFDEADLPVNEGLVRLQVQVPMGLYISGGLYLFHEFFVKEKQVMKRAKKMETIAAWIGGRLDMIQRASYGIPTIPYFFTVQKRISLVAEDGKKLDLEPFNPEQILEFGQLYRECCGRYLP